MGPLHLLVPLSLSLLYVSESACDADECAVKGDPLLQKEMQPVKRKEQVQEDMKQQLQEGLQQLQAEHEQGQAEHQGLHNEMMMSGHEPTNQSRNKSDKPECRNAEVQSPRDLTFWSHGVKKPKAATLTVKQTKKLPLVNVHFHLGAEHRSEEYKEPEHHEHGFTVRAGHMCNISGMNEAQLEPYEFEYCKGDMAVGKSYEVHYVHSSAGYSKRERRDGGDMDIDDRDGMSDGLGSAVHGRGLLNPMITVQARVYQIVRGAGHLNKMVHGFHSSPPERGEAVMYPGPSTGTSYDNDRCSPYSITWHVDLKCRQVSPESFDNFCKQLSERYGIEDDLHPHGSRKLVDSKYVVESKYVKPLA